MSVCWLTTNGTNSWAVPILPSRLSARPRASMMRKLAKPMISLHRLRILSSLACTNSLIVLMYLPMQLLSFALSVMFLFNRYRWFRNIPCCSLYLNIFLEVVLLLVSGKVFLHSCCIGVVELRNFESRIWKKISPWSWIIVQLVLNTTISVKYNKLYIYSDKHIFTTVYLIFNQL